MVLISISAWSLKALKIAIAGTSYKGLSNAIFLVRHNELVAHDIAPEKVTMFNRKESPIEYLEAEDFFMKGTLNFRATLNKIDAHTGAALVIIANRMTEDMSDIAGKVYNPDLFGADF